MTTIRTVKMSYPSRPTLEGAGVRLKRAVGFSEEGLFDPFLLLDDFHSSNPTDYIKGFPWHPHRGIETVTYILRGNIAHGDSLGNSGEIESGDVQWMTAGSGIIHQEMPRAWEGDMRGFQLWVNLPAASKMMEPRYRDEPADTIPELQMPSGAEVKMIAGKIGEFEGPVKDIVRSPEYFDVTVEPGGKFEHDTVKGHTAFIYTVEGEVVIDGETVATDNVALLTKGSRVEAEAPSGGRFLLIIGEPLGEPIAWRGPIVMNTEEELETAFREYHEGSFIK